MLRYGNLLIATSPCDTINMMHMNWRILSVMVVIGLATILLVRSGYTPKRAQLLPEALSVPTVVMPTMHYDDRPRPTFPKGVAPTSTSRQKWTTHVDPYLRFHFAIPPAWSIYTTGLTYIGDLPTWEVEIHPPARSIAASRARLIEIHVSPATVSKRSSWGWADNYLRNLLSPDEGMAKQRPLTTLTTGELQFRLATEHRERIAIFFHNDLMYRIRLQHIEAIDDKPISQAEWNGLVTVFEHVLASFGVDPTVTSTLFFNDPLPPRDPVIFE